MKDIVEIYKECGDFQKAVKLSGLPHLVAHIKLLNSGVLKIQDKINYGSNFQPTPILSVCFLTKVKGLKIILFF